MPKSEPRYDAGYPLAIELVYAQKLGDNTRLFCKWVREACLKTYRAIGKSGALLNTDAADGKDVSVNDVLGDFLAAATVKKVRVYIKQRAGKNYSRMTREQQERLIRETGQDVVTMHKVCREPARQIRRQHYRKSAGILDRQTGVNHLAQ